ncbi:hypothetical protein RB195_013786 [Necator americanus]|uniref:Uncharacterized protein n=1 Tax=Necator americanus TaxID=51031 RepID=A0ABR1DYS2_NECAM
MKTVRDVGFGPAAEIGGSRSPSNNMRTGIRSWVSQTTDVRGLKSIEKTRKLGRWVPHVKTQYDMDRCPDMALPLKSLTHTWLEHLGTGVEKRIPYSNIHRRAQWVDKGADAEDVPKLKYTAKTLCSAYGRAYLALNTGSCLLRDAR